MQSTSDEEEIILDVRLQSVEGVIGYLNQAIKMKHKPKKLEQVILTLAEEVHALQKQLQRIKTK